MQVIACPGVQPAQIAVEAGNQIGDHGGGQGAAFGGGVDQGASPVARVGHPDDQSAVDQSLDGLGGPARGLDGPPGQIAGGEGVFAGESYTSEGAELRGGQAGGPKGIGQPDL